MKTMLGFSDNNENLSTQRQKTLHFHSNSNPKLEKVS